MKHLTRLQILEEIATKVAELNVLGNGKLSDEIITKAFSLQTEKKRNAITKQNKTRAIRSIKVDLIPKIIEEAIKDTDPIISIK